MRHIIAATALSVLYLGIGAHSSSMLQETQRDSLPAASRCPQVLVACPKDIASDEWTYRVLVDGAPPGPKYSYKWSVSEGAIKTGQGTPSITIDRPETREITVEVEVEGLPEGCRNHPSCTFIKN
jgi:hypothetical protein